MERLRKIEQAATPGPWQWVDNENDEPLTDSDSEFIDAEAEREASLRTTWQRETESVGPLPEWIIGEAMEVRGPDAEFIVTARNTYAALLDVAEWVDGYVREWLASPAANPECSGCAGTPAPRDVEALLDRISEVTP